MSFQLRRFQFPIRLACAITIIAAQVQSLKLCGLDLHTDCFSQEQLYVVFSIVGKPDSLYICQTIEQEHILYTYKYCKIKHWKRVFYLFILFHLNRMAHSNACSGTASNNNNEGNNDNTITFSSNITMHNNNNDNVNKNTKNNGDNNKIVVKL